MKKVLVIYFIVLSSCKEQNASIPKEQSLSLINYLKTEYKVDPQIERFDSLYVKRLTAENKSFNIDSLINSKIRLNTYKALNLDFIEYYNHYSYRDKTDSDCYSIYLIRDNKTGKYYQDYITENTCLIIEDYCSWSSMQNKIIKKEVKSDISDADITAYNSITSKRIYGENETQLDNKRIGIQSYLNAEFKFSPPTKPELDSLFYAYDKYLYYRNDTLLNSPNELYSFLRIQAGKIRAEADYGNLNERLELLKSQVNLLLLQIGQGHNENLFFWIYKSDSRLRVRILQISGNKKSAYAYGVTEYNTCF